MHAMEVLSEKVLFPIMNTYKNLFWALLVKFPIFSRFSLTQILFPNSSRFSRLRKTMIIEEVGSNNFSSQKL